MAAKRAASKRAASSYHFICSREGKREPASVSLWRSKADASLLPEMPAFDPELLDETQRGIWRYRALLPFDGEPVTLGEGATPLIETSIVGMPVHMKLEYMQPTGSYKDRGTALLAAAIAQSGARGAVIDSSGNAGASMSAYLAHLNVQLQLFVPRETATAKLRQAAAHGATIDRSAASRDVAAELAQAAISGNTVYASHVYSPYFLAGLMTLAWEIWESLDRSAPDNIVVPVGNGLLVLGLHHGFSALLDAGLIERLPRLFGVQSRACAPVYSAFSRGSDEVAAVPSGKTIAHGIRIGKPPRGAEILSAIRTSEGSMLNVSDTEIRRGQALAANLGWYVEPTGAVAIAGVVKLDKVIPKGESVLVPLTGTGLKS